MTLRFDINMILKVFDTQICIGRISIKVDHLFIYNVKSTY